MYATNGQTDGQTDGQKQRSLPPQGHNNVIVQSFSFSCSRFEAATETASDLENSTVPVQQGFCVISVALCIRRTLCRHVTIGTPMVIFCCFDCLLTVFDDWYTVGTAKMTIGIPVVTCLPRLYQLCTNRQNSQKQSNSKNDRWCTNRHSTQSPANTQSHFRRSYLKANDITIEGTKTINMRIIYESALMLFTQKSAKLVCTCRNYSMPKVARFLRHSVEYSASCVGGHGNSTTG